MFKPDRWFIKKVDKLRRNFLWEAEERVAGGKCLVNWSQVCSPKRYGGLGVKDIKSFSRALRVRWEWFRWDDVDGPWKGTPTPCDGTDKQLFRAVLRYSWGMALATLRYSGWTDGLTARLRVVWPRIFLSSLGLRR